MGAIVTSPAGSPATAATTSTCTVRFRNPPRRRSPPQQCRASLETIRFHALPRNRTLRLLHGNGRRLPTTQRAPAVHRRLSFIPPAATQPRTTRQTQRQRKRRHPPEVRARAGAGKAGPVALAATAMSTVGRLETAATTSTSIAHWCQAQLLRAPQPQLHASRTIRRLQAMVLPARLPHITTILHRGTGTQLLTRKRTIQLLRLSIPLAVNRLPTPPPPACQHLPLSTCPARESAMGATVELATVTTTALNMATAALTN